MIEPWFSIETKCGTWYHTCYIDSLYFKENSWMMILFQLGCLTRRCQLTSRSREVEILGYFQSTLTFEKEIFAFFLITTLESFINFSVNWCMDKVFEVKFSPQWLLKVKVSTRFQEIYSIWDGNVLNQRSRQNSSAGKFI